MEQVSGQEWTVRMAEAPAEFAATTLCTADLLGVSAVVEQGQPTYFTAVVRVGDIGCPMPLTAKAFLVLALLLDGERVRDVRVVLSREDASGPFDTVHGLYSYEQAREVAEYVLQKRDQGGESDAPQEPPA